MALYVLGNYPSVLSIPVLLVIELPQNKPQTHDKFMQMVMQAAPERWARAVISILWHCVQPLRLMISTRSKAFGWSKWMLFTKQLFWRKASFDELRNCHKTVKRWRDCHAALSAGTGLHLGTSCNNSPGIEWTRFSLAASHCTIISCWVGCAYCSVNASLHGMLLVWSGIGLHAGPNRPLKRFYTLTLNSTESSALWGSRSSWRALRSPQTIHWYTQQKIEVLLQ